MGIPAEALLPFVLGENGGGGGGSVTVDAQFSSTSRNPVQNKAITGALADEYDASKTYAVGDLCIHNGSLYACITAIETAEAWNAAHWKTSNFGDELSEVSRQISDLETRLKSGDEEDAELHLGFYLDENGDLCQVDEEVNNG